MKVDQIYKLAQVKGFYCYPTLAVLDSILSWLREVHKIDVLVTMSEFSRTYGYNIYAIEEGKTVRYSHMYVKMESYHEALLEGIENALNNFIK